MPVNTIRLTVDIDCLKINTSPLVQIWLDQDHLQDLVIDGPCQYHLEREIPPGAHQFVLKFRNKNYDELIPGHDMAVLIRGVRFQTVDHDFSVYSRYLPDYPQPWASQQGRLKSQVYSNYLGWNGDWILDFETPIYRWMHGRMKLGWLL